MEKIGYIVKIFNDTHIEIVKVTVVGNSLSIPYLVESWPTRKKQVIWSTDSDKTFGGWTESPRWAEDVFFSLDEAKQKIVDTIAEIKIETDKKIAKLIGVYTHLENVDLNTLPKDEYISPFTGKKA